jgi:hypothetical protein
MTPFELRRIGERTNVVIEVKMTHLPTLQRIQELFPGRLAQGSLSKNSLSKLPQYRWSLDTMGSAELLPRLLPYLVTKKEVAHAALHLCERPIDRQHMDTWASNLKLAA